MHTNDHLITIYSKPEHDKGGHHDLVSQAKAITTHVLEIDVTREPPTPRLIAEMLERAGADIRDLIDDTHPYYHEKLEGAAFEDQEWINVLHQNPQLWRKPVAVSGHRAVICNYAYDVNQLVDDERRP